MEAGGRQLTWLESGAWRERLQGQRNSLSETRKRFLENQVLRRTGAWSGDLVPFLGHQLESKLSILSLKLSLRIFM